MTETATAPEPAPPPSEPKPPEPRRTFRAEKISRNFLLGFTPRDYDGDAYRIMVEPLRMPQPDGRTSTRLGFPLLLLSGLTDEPGEVAFKVAKVLNEHYGATDVVTIPQAEHDALVDERRHWRETAAIAICDLMRAAEGDSRLALLGAKVPRSVVRQQLEMWTNLLESALTGDTSPARCEACDKSIRVGDICIPYQEGQTHADCEHPRPGKHQAGDTLALTDAAWVDEDGRERHGPVEVTLFAETPLYEDAAIARILTTAQAFLTGAGGLDTSELH